MEITKVVPCLSSIPTSNVAVKYEAVTVCPICKAAIDPVELGSKLYTSHNGKYFLSNHYLCKACDKSFICQYSQSIQTSSANATFIFDILDYSAPLIHTPEIFESRICNASPDFVKTYNQALAAESYLLDQIAGVGYRKSLEFLIKDFLIKEHPEKEDIFKKSALNVCINDHVDNPQLKIAASRATWLGNDQTHYLMLYTDKDIEDLKRLIKISVYWISMILMTKESEAIPHPKDLNNSAPKS